VRSGLTTPVEGTSFRGSSEIEGPSMMSSGSCARLRRDSSRGTPRDITPSSLKAAAAAVVDQGRRSGMLSGISSPRGRNSPLGSPRQMSHTDSARSLSLLGPWQQYKNVANRLAQMQVMDGQSNSQCSSPRSRKSTSNTRSRRGTATTSQRDGVDHATPNSQSGQPQAIEKVKSPRKERHAPELTGTATEEDTISPAISPTEKAHEKSPVARTMVVLPPEELDAAENGGPT
jgi:hypothetical protein